MQSVILKKRYSSVYLPSYWKGKEDFTALIDIHWRPEQRPKEAYI